MPGLEEFPCNLSILFLKVGELLWTVHGVRCVVYGAWKKSDTEGVFLRLKCKRSA